MTQEKLYIKNKKAYFEYSILDKYVAGIKLLGTEIKSIREGKANLGDAFCTFINGELYVRNLHISEYTFGSFYNHEQKRDRVLLLNKKELKKLQTRGEEKGFTIVPLNFKLVDIVPCKSDTNPFTKGSKIMASV